MTEPDISVLMCVHNGENFVQTAIESILGQRDAEFELVVVDDGSTDATRDILANFRDEISVVVSPTNAGLGPSRNLAVASSAGRHIVHCDHDDLLPAGSLAIRRALLQEHPDAEMSLGWVEEFVSSGFEEQLAADGLVARPAIPGSLTAMMTTRAAQIRVGPFEPLRQAACVNWMMRARQLAVPTVTTDHVVYRRRLHGSNMSRSEHIDQRERFAAIRLARGSAGAADIARS